MRKVLGYTMIASVIAVLVVFTAQAGGWKVALETWGAALFGTAMIVAGINLVVD